MDRNELNQILGAILGTLAETGEAPESSLYMLVGMNMGKWEQVRGILVGNRLIEIDATHAVRPTKSGLDLGQKVNETLAKAKGGAS
jgi:hypothetical protein